MLKSFGLSHRLIIGSLFLSLSVFVIMGIMLGQFSKLIEATGYLNAADAVLTVGSQIQNDLIKLYQAQEIFDQFLSEQTWQHYFSLNQKMENLLGKLQNLREFKKQAEIVEALNKSRVEMGAILDNATYTINPNFPIGALSTGVLKRIRETRKAIQLQIKELILQQRSERLKTRQMLSDQLVRLKSMIYWIALLVLAGGFVFAAYLHRSTLFPLRQLIDFMATTREQSKSYALEPIGAPEMRELISAFNQMQEKLERHQRRQEAQLSLAMTVAHEVRNPITAIGTAIQVLQQNYPESGPDKEIFAEILKEVYRVNTIISDLLIFSRAKPVKWEEIQIEAFFSEMQIFFQHTFKERQITLEVRISPETTTIQGDCDQLHRVFLNLFNNSLDAIEESGKIIITVSLAKDERFLITYEDSGVGIPAENAEKVLMPFFTTKNKGTGLGLAIVFNIIERHQGEISIVEAEELSGAGFRILLPCRPIIVDSPDNSKENQNATVTTY